MADFERRIAALEEIVHELRTFITANTIEIDELRDRLAVIVQRVEQLERILAKLK